MSRRAATVLAKKKGRSRLSNGHALPFVKVNQAYARRFRDLLILHVDQLGGPDNVSPSEHALIKRAAVIICECERRELQFAKAGEASDTAIEIYQRLSNTLRRLLETLGLQRRARDITPPNLNDYLRQRSRQTNDTLDLDAAE